MQNNFSSIFQNIDGNKTNFDAFSLELERIAEKFQIIGLAETNVSADESSVYQLEGYNSFYQSKHINKTKGTGVAIYAKESLNAVVNNELSWVTKNLETLFITVQHDEPLHIGVLYRPPSGDSTEALNELSKIAELCPKKNVYILGDFNINVHDQSSKIVDDFENIIFGLGLVPLISISTHHKPGCKETCIDNILTNSTDDVTHSGTISTSISHHHAIFTIFKSPIITNTNQSGPKHLQYYDYSNKNVNKFVNELEVKLNSEPPKDFSEFFGNSHGGTIPPRTPPGSAWVRAGPRRTPAESAKFNFAAEQKIPPRNPPRTRRTAAEQICSAADPIGSAADWRNFRRRNG